MNLLLCLVTRRGDIGGGGGGSLAVICADIPRFFFILSLDFASVLHVPFYTLDPTGMSSMLSLTRTCLY